MAPVRPHACDDLTEHAGPIVAGHLTSAVDLGPQPVTHSYAALTFYTGGRAHIEQRGAWILQPGDVFVVPAGQVHQPLEKLRPEYWVLALSVPSLVGHGRLDLLEPFERVRDGASAVIQIPADRHIFLESLWRELEGHASQASALDPIGTSLVTLIVAEIARAAQPNPSPKAGRKSVATESLRFIERNCLRRLTLEEVAAAVGRSPAYVTTALTQATGRSAVQWIVTGRLAEARRLLRASNEKIDGIAERIGYADPTHFIRMFRRAHGMTPAAWRIAQREQGINQAFGPTHQTPCR